MFPMVKPTGNPVNRPIFPGAGGYGGSVTMGQVVRARQAAAAQTARNATQAAEMAKPMFPGAGGYGGSITKGQAGLRRRPQAVMGTGSAGRTAPSQAGRKFGQYSGPTRAHTINANMAASQKRGINRAVSSVPKNGSGTDLSKFAGNLTEDSFPKGKKPLMSMFGDMTRRKRIGIGLGLGVAAGVAMNRRGEGVSPGRQSNARY